MSQITTTAKKTANIRDLMIKFKPQIALVAPKHLTPDRIVRIAMTSIHRTPKLADCTIESLLGAVLTCTQLGLEPDSASGRAYLIPYKTTCTLIVGYKGLMDLARRSGEISALEARVVHKGDTFTYQYGTAPAIHHIPNLDSEGEMIAVYAVAQFKNVGFQFEVMSRAAIAKIRKRSKAGEDGPWVTDFDEMARKINDEAAKRSLAVVRAGLEAIRNRQQDVNDKTELLIERAADARKLTRAEYRRAARLARLAEQSEAGHSSFFGWWVGNKKLPFLRVL